MTAAKLRALRSYPELEMIDVQATTGFVGHGYFISNPSVLSDLILLLRDDLAAGQENGRPLERTPGGFWILKDGYPNLPETEQLVH